MGEHDPNGVKRRHEAALRALARFTSKCGCGREIAGAHTIRGSDWPCRPREGGGGGAFTGATEAQRDARTERHRPVPLSPGDMRGHKQVSPV